MSVSVRIPTILRNYTDGSSEVTAEGSTLAEVLDDLEANHNGIKARVLDDSGELRRFVNVYVGNDDVRFIEGLQSPTPEGTQISIIPAVAAVAVPVRAPHLATREQFHRDLVKPPSGRLACHATSPPLTASSATSCSTSSARGTTPRW